MKKIFTIVLIAATISTQAKEIEFSYNTSSAEEYGYGFNIAETYDVAILINEPSLIGSKVNGISVNIPGGENISSPSVWLSSDLILERKEGKLVNAPDITVQEGMLSDGILAVTFDTPYLIEGPIYAGYSFTVDKKDQSTATPVNLVSSSRPGGFYIHTSRSKLKWIDATSIAEGVSTMKVFIEGDFHDNAAVFTSYKTNYGSLSDDNNIATVQLVNHGTNALHSVEYTWEIAENSGQGHITLETPLPAVWGASTPVQIDLGKLTQGGTLPLTMTVLTVNGETNSDKCINSIIPIKVHPFVPVTRPLVEEFTGLWCGWCPRGYVAMETMGELYPNSFIGLAYHKSDAMSGNYELPYGPDGYPAAYINRGEKIDPAQLYDQWPVAAEVIAPAAIDINAEWADDSYNEIIATSCSRFLEDYDKAKFEVTYALVADNLSQPDWGQKNYYSTDEGKYDGYLEDMPGDLGQLFLNGNEYVFGLVFNDVVVSFPYPNGIEGSIPTNIVCDNPITHSCSFDLTKLGSLNDIIASHKDNLRVVVILIDRETGKPVNCNTSGYLPTPSSQINTLKAEAIAETTWYNINGQRLCTPTQGVCIRVDRMSDGSLKTSKIFIP